MNLRTDWGKKSAPETESKPEIEKNICIIEICPI